MSERTYSVAVDMAGDQDDIRRLQWQIQNQHDIVKWWNHLPGLFIVVSSLSAKELGRLIHAWLRDVSFVLMAVDPNTAYGFLPEDAAIWLEQRKSPSSPEVRSSEQV